MYLSEKLWPAHHLLRSDSTIESLCEHLNEVIGKDLVRPKDVEAARHELRSASKDSAALEAKTVFKWRMDTLWSKMTDREKDYWKKVWAKSKAAAEKQKEEKERARHTKTTIQRVGRLLALDWTYDLDEKFGRAS